MPRSLDVPLEYVRLGLRFDRLESGFVDAYTGDKRIRAAVEDEPAPSPQGLRDQARALLGEQGARLAAEMLRRGRGLVGDLGAHPWVAGERVDEAGLEPVEAQPQAHVLQGDVDRAGCHGRESLSRRNAGSARRSHGVHAGSRRGGTPASRRR